MSRGPGQIERRIGELFAATKDRALSVADLCEMAFALGCTTASRAQRLSATRAAHRILGRASKAHDRYVAVLNQVIAETREILGREPGGRGRENVYFWTGTSYVSVDEAFADAMERAPSNAAYRQAWPALKRELDRFDGAAFKWRTTETDDRRLWFHPADYPVRVWAAAIRPGGVVWADTEIVRITEDRVDVRYQGEPARLSRDKLARHWTLYRNVFFTSSRSGEAARAFDDMWFQRYWRPGSAAPLQMQMRLGEAMELLGVPTNFTREDVIAAFRRAAKKAHPDLGGSAELFRKLIEARDRLLAALGTTAAAPKMPEFAPKGVRLRYRTYHPSSRARLGQTRRLTG